MIKNNKGQAFVEFIIILPVFIMIVFCIVDFGRIFYVKSDLESQMDRIISMYESNKNYDAIKSYIDKNISDAKLDISNENNENVIIQIGKNVDLFTPGLNVILDDPYLVTIKRVLPYE